MRWSGARAQGRKRPCSEPRTRQSLSKALEENDWNRSKTAQQIGIPRTTLLFKMKQLTITS
ncbi:MAG: hypothetical protein JSW58_05555 [Candidatus Latescibacterota bacterium]|nr:MAG: hypothetical protein JSW58_05555 [Candidatus Latescibacterota bacterium]